MSLSTDQKRTLAIDLGLPAVMILLWVILPTQTYRHLYYIAHLLILMVILPLTIYAALALKEQGKHALFVLAAGTGLFIVVSIAVIRYLDAKLMGTGIWF
jgi:drug/metabolite transporter superfamily protein YnfA